ESRDGRIEVAELVVADFVREDERDARFRQPAGEELPAQVDVPPRGGERVRSCDPQHECLARRATHQRLQTFLGTTYELDGPAAALDVDDLLDRFAGPLPVRVGAHPGIILPTVWRAPLALVMAAAGVPPRSRWTDPISARLAAQSPGTPSSAW